MVFTTPVIGGFGPLTRLEEVVQAPDGKGEQPNFYRTKSDRFFDLCHKKSTSDTAVNAGCELTILQATPERIEDFNRWRVAQEIRVKFEGKDLSAWFRDLTDAGVVMFYDAWDRIEKLHTDHANTLDLSVVAFFYYAVEPVRPKWWPQSARYLVALADGRTMAVDKKMRMTPVKAFLVEEAQRRDIIQSSIERNPAKELK